LVYFVELIIFSRGIYLKSFKRPVKTLKAIFLTLVSFAIVILFLIWNLKLQNNLQLPRLLIFDILTPLVISIVVLIFKPFFVVIRNLKLKKAENKLEKIKSLNGLKVIAITGSYGKTSTKEFLSTILSKKFKVLATDRHQNSEIGVANCILNNLKPSHQIFIAEVGAYNKGKVKEVCSMLNPRIGIVTGTNEQHLALFGSLKNLLSAEGGGELADALPEDGILIVNGDNKYCLDLYKNFNGIKKLYSARKNVIDADIFAYDIEVKKTLVSFIAETKNKEINHFEANVLGKQNVQNLLAAILAANVLGMNFIEISEACKNILHDPEGAPAGMVLKQGKHGIDIVDSSYSANPDGVFAGLEYLNIFPQKKVIVMPCLIELGEKSSEIHEKIGRKIGEVCDMAIITSKDKFKELKDGATEAGMSEKNILLCDKPQDIYSVITLFCKYGDAVLLEGRVPAGLIKLLAE